MSILPRIQRHDGYYDDNGHWQRTKFCFRSCGEACTCGPPMGRWYAAEHDKSKPAAETQEVQS